MFGNAPRTSEIKCSRGDAQIGGYPQLPQKIFWPTTARSGCGTACSVLGWRWAVGWVAPPPFLWRLNDERPDPVLRDPAQVPALRAVIMPLTRIGINLEPRIRRRHFHFSLYWLNRGTEFLGAICHFRWNELNFGTEAGLASSKLPVNRLSCATALCGA